MKLRRKSKPTIEGRQVKDASLELARRLARNSSFIDGKNSPAFSRQIDTQLTYGEANLGQHIRLPKTSNHIVQDLMTDLFWNMFQLKHKQKPNTPSGRKFSRELLKHLTNMPTFKNGRRSTLGKTASSIAAARALLKELLEDEEMREMMNQLSQMSDENDEQENEDEDEESSSGKGNGKGKGKGKPQKQNNEDDDEQEDNEDGEGEGDQDQDGENENEDSGDGDEEGQGQGQDEGDSDGEEEQEDGGDSEQQQEIIDRLKEKLNTIEGSIGATASIAEGFEEGNEVGKLIASLGMSENGMTPEEVEKVLNVVQHDDFQKLANLIGRSYGTAKEVLRGRSAIPLIIDEAARTKDIEDIFDDELALMSPEIDAGVRREQIEKFMRSGLPGMTRTSQNQYGGTKIFALDESGSTDSDFRDTKTGMRTEIKISAVERGFALGLARAAKTQGQAWYMFGWSSRDEYTETITHKDRIGKLMDFIAYNINGGQTSFDTALGRSLEIMLSLPEDERFQTDIVIITDGQGSLYDDVIRKFEECKREYGTRLYVITIGSDSHQRLEEIADFVLPFTSMADASGKMAELMWIERERTAKQK